MSQYSKVVVAIDLSEESDLVAARARAIATSAGSELHLVHVIEPLSFAYGVDIPMDFSGLQDEIQEQATGQLQRFAEKNGIAADHQHILLGRPEVEIHAVAEKISADLIVVGSHGRYGLALLMGSTANGVLHGASCDVLAVRVGS
ncbi:universal stress protein UspA [Halioglobus japonicus]|uniref:Universal stress protein n=1 Tax=Halioglobus japonicus TaxID=930805 RepID=A0AAP8SNR5_9GAMM|nr:MULTISPECIES: universal stress protein [Halioglobus]AQA18744.1 universal stress protein UspA [Halioglobus japonicus]KZX60200.1 universal stress protein UspA [Halioglobus sp. HI00S01]PLW86774.1 universal stress protein [Halioglobus japonicus]GHD11138.1 universal stress protein [Halioglobus japonicus]